eukprot:TRINITY_DN16204_c0_g1_i1.p1 TRINITY_DN16204_c0_g1~~TRINITY_DN16204_c0_g1_i1.p1  ORF type:complete len:836 (+),score=222.51 TRINITY_DN16204_c0_g1_i1:52-2559(+)
MRRQCCRRAPALHVQSRCYNPAVVPLGEGAHPKPMPLVKSTLGHRWFPYHEMVKMRQGEATVNAAMFKEMLEKAGLNTDVFAEVSGKQFGPRTLYVALGTDVGSVTLLALAQKWAAQERAPLKLKALMVLGPCSEEEKQNRQIVVRYFKSRGADVRAVTPTDEDIAQVEAWYGESFEWRGLTPDDERVAMLRRWVLYSRIKLAERHPFGAHVLFGTNLDRNLQRIADRMVPDDAIPADGSAVRPQPPSALWDLSLEESTFQIPLYDTANADWKVGQVKCHRPFLAFSNAQLERTAQFFEGDKLRPLLTTPPPVSARLDDVQVSEMLKLAKRCHVRTRAMRRLAAEFISRNCRLDYKLGWSTLNRAEVDSIPEEALLLVVTALVAFSSSQCRSDWLKTPPEAVHDLLDLVLCRSDLPASPVHEIPGTGVALVFEDPYDPVLSSDASVFAFVPSPTEEDRCPTLKFPAWASKTRSHPHPPTKCFTGTTFGRWLVQLYTTEERRQQHTLEGRCFYVTHLRHPDDPWWQQVSNAHRFLRHLRSQIHDPALHAHGHPSRPSHLILRDIPLILMGTEGLAGPSDPDEEVPTEASHLFAVACPPFGYWAPQFRNHVFQGGVPHIYKAPGYILKPQWLLDFLPVPGLLGPMFVPISRQVQIQIRAAEHLSGKMKSAKTEVAFDTGLMSEEQYKRVKVAAVNQVMLAEGDPADIDTAGVYKGAYDTLKGKGLLQKSQDPELLTSREAGFVEDEDLWGGVEAAGLAETVNTPPSEPSNVALSDFAKSWSNVKRTRRDSAPDFRLEAGFKGREKSSSNSYLNCSSWAATTPAERQNARYPMHGPEG